METPYTYKVDTEGCIMPATRLKDGESDYIKENRALSEEIRDLVHKHGLSLEETVRLRRSQESTQRETAINTTKMNIEIGALRQALQQISSYSPDPTWDSPVWNREVFSVKLGTNIFDALHDHGVRAGRQWAAKIAKTALEIYHGHKLTDNKNTQETKKESEEREAPIIVVHITVMQACAAVIVGDHLLLWEDSDTDEIRPVVRTKELANSLGNAFKVPNVFFIVPSSNIPKAWQYSDVMQLAQQLLIDWRKGA